MGWFGTYGKFPGFKAVVDGIKFEDSNIHVVAHALVNMKEGWMVLEDKSTGERFARLHLLRIGADEWDYKPIDEFNHPYYYSIPEKLFKMLTPLADNEGNKYALTWRAKVTERLNKLNGNKKLLRNNVLFKLGSESLYRVEDANWDKSNILIKDMNLKTYKLSKKRFYKEAVIESDATGQVTLF